MWLPIANGTHAKVREIDYLIVPRQNFENILEQRSLAQDKLKNQIVSDGVLVGVNPQSRVLRQSLDLGGKTDPIGVAMVIERLYSQVVSRREQNLTSAVKNQKREHPV